MPRRLLIDNGKQYYRNRRTGRPCLRIVAGERESRSNVASRFSIQGSATMSHDDLRVQLQAVEPRGGHDPRLRAGADGGDQENSEYEPGIRHSLTGLLMVRAG